MVSQILGDSLLFLFPRTGEFVPPTPLEPSVKTKLIDATLQSKGKTCDAGLDHIREHRPQARSRPWLKSVAR